MSEHKKSPSRGRALLLMLAVLAVFLVLGLLVLKLRGALPATAAQDDFEVPEQIIICLDAGHGDTDAGAVNGERLEKDDNLRMVLSVKEALEQEGFENLTVILTREDDTFLELQQRVDVANEANATLFVSLHRNSGGGKGVEVWTSHLAQKTECRLAKNIMDALESAEVQKVRGVKHGTAGNPDISYTVVGRTEMPACLVELGFIDDETDNALLDSHWDAYAQAIADGILQTVKLK